MTIQHIDNEDIDNEDIGWADEDFHWGGEEYTVCDGCDGDLHVDDAHLVHKPVDDEREFKTYIFCLTCLNDSTKFP